MTGLNLHDIVGDALAELNPWKDLVFTTTKVEWVQGSRQPTRTTEEVTVKGKIQPANQQELGEMGYAVTEYQYFTFWVSFTATQADRLRQLGCDTFTVDGEKYKVVGKDDWIQDGWRQGYCYLVKVERTEENTDE